MRALSGVWARRESQPVLPVVGHLPEHVADHLDDAGHGPAAEGERPRRRQRVRLRVLQEVTEPVPVTRHADVDFRRWLELREDGRRRVTNVPRWIKYIDDILAAEGDARVTSWQGRIT